MAGAFLADTLREQARAELQGQMMQDQIARQVARQIVGQIAQQEVGQSINRMRSRGGTIQNAADRTSRREVGMTQLEMQKDQARKAKEMGLITAAAAATGALGGYLATQPGYEGPKFDAPDTELQIPDEEAFREKLVNPETSGFSPDLGSTTLDTSMKNYRGITTDLAPTPDTQLSLGELGSMRTTEDLLGELSRQDPRDPLGMSGYTGVAPGTALSSQIRGADAYRGKTLKF
jgi:hypothetical protein